MNGKDIFLGLKYIGEDLIQQAEYGVFPSQAQEKPKGRLLRKPYFLAALIALMILLMGCAVALLSLEDLRIGQEEYTQPMRYEEDGGKIPAQEKEKSIISCQGAEGSPNYQAAIEWYTFQRGYDPDGAKRQAASDFQRPASYTAYGCYTQEMQDQIDAICEKYGLALAGDAALVLDGDEDILAQELGLDGILHSSAEAEASLSGGYLYTCGNFNLQYFVTLAQGDWPHETCIAYQFWDKDIFGTTVIVIEDPETAQQWNYTTQDGTALLMIAEEDQGHILCDRADAFVTISFDRTLELEEGILSREAMEQLAEALDFSLTTRSLADMPQLQQTLDTRHRQRDEEPEDDAQAQARKKAWEENQCKDSYAALVAQIRDNESYFTQQCSPSYADFWQTMEYALMDLTGDGEAELLFGKDGSIQSIWTMKDGVTRQVIASGREIYLCQGNVLEFYTFEDGAPYHQYCQIQEGIPDPIVSVYYLSESGVWETERNPGGGELPTRITEEEAQEIIASYPRQEVPMQSVQEFPME